MSKLLRRQRPLAPAAGKFMLTAAVLCVSPVLFAAEDSVSSIAFGQMAMQLVGGLALFLFGIDQMTDALKAVAGERMRVILGRLTANRYVGAMTGAFVTAIIQSSSVTTVLVVGFTTAGLMSFSQSIGVIMGANIGTTITAQIVAFKVTKAAFLMIAVGFGFLFFSKRDKLRYYGGILMGLGLVFFGMTVMSDAMQPLRNYQPFLDIMIRMETPLVGILAAAAFTAVIQSSSATTAVVIVLAGQGFITLPAGIALVFGANIGTCITAMLAAIGKPREAVRVAVTHVFFNIAGVLLWLAFIDDLATFVRVFSPVHVEFTGADRLAAEVPRQIANAHTLFNVANTLVFIWFTTLIARLVEWLVPDRPLDQDAIIKTKYLDEELLSTPSLALDLVRREIRHMGEQVSEMLAAIMPAILHGSIADLDRIQRRDELVDVLHADIVLYLGKISRLELTEKQTEELMRLMNAVNDLENIGDVVEVNLVELGRRRLERAVSVSRPTQVVLTDFHMVVMDAVAAAIRAVAEDSVEAAQSVTNLKKEITRITNSAALHEARRLVANEPQRIEAYTIEMDITEKLQRIYYFARRMARTVRSTATDDEPSDSAASSRNA
ncbi:MAG: Na/Pi cotransporter family protein [Gammaproteobacteria bacterium]|nr:Na/Pi cotransporter family protein [Gammaproteobacteria bacterium]